MKMGNEPLKVKKKLDQPINHFKKVWFLSHEFHNPNCDIVCGQLDENTVICYGVYVKEKPLNKVGTEFFEYYSGKNYVSGSNQTKSYSRGCPVDRIIPKYRKTWQQLKDMYKEIYKLV